MGYHGRNTGFRGVLLGEIELSTLSLTLIQPQLNWIEQPPSKRQVVGSIPTGWTKLSPVGEMVDTEDLKSSG